MAANLLEAVVAFLGPRMATDLGQTDLPKVWADYAGEVDYPYAVITDGQESYAFQSGASITYIADGMLQIAFYANSKSQARQLARTCVLLFLAQDNVSDDLLVFDDGILLELRPAGAFSQVITDTGTGQPTVFARVLNFQYKELFPSY